MRVQPFSFLEQKDIVGPSPGPTFPLETEAIHRFEEMYTNRDTVTTVTDLVTGNSNLEIFEQLQGYIDESEFIQLNSTSGFSNERLGLISVFINEQTSGNRDAYSFIILEEHGDDSVYTNTFDNLYLCDFRSLDDWFASYMTDKDSVQDEGKFGGGDMFVYVPGNPTFEGTISSTNFTDGDGTVGGGDDYYQWVGNSPAGRGATGFRRLWGFNIPTANVFNTSTNGGAGKSYKIYGNSSNQQGGTGKIFAHALFDTHLTTTSFGQLVAYYQSLGYLT